MNLKTFILTENRLIQLPENLSSLKKLRTLSINNNNLESIPNSIFELIEIEKIDVRNNFLTKKDIQELKKLPNIMCCFEKE